jgi:hypothetical protein
VSIRRFPPPWSVLDALLCSHTRLLLYFTKVDAKRSGNLCSATYWHGLERNMPMTSVLLTVFEMSVAMAIGFVLGGFVLGRIWQITYLGHRLENLGHRLEEQRDLISVFQRIEAKCSEAVGAIEKILN